MPTLAVRGPGLTLVARPKSATLRLAPSPSSRFSSLMSLWTMPCAAQASQFKESKIGWGGQGLTEVCRCASASMRGLMMPCATCSSAKYPPAWATVVYRLPPGAYSCASIAFSQRSCFPDHTKSIFIFAWTRYMPSASSNAAYSSIMLLCCRPQAMSISRATWGHQTVSVHWNYTWQLKPHANK